MIDNFRNKELSLKHKKLNIEDGSKTWDEWLGDAIVQAYSFDKTTCYKQFSRSGITANHH